MQDIIILSQPNQSAESIKKSLNVTAEERTRLEIATRIQSKSREWIEARAWRITGSKCGVQHEPTDALLKSVLYPTFLAHIPAIKWGLENEKKACAAYTCFMRQHGHRDITTTPSGFIVHDRFGWLGASPDAFVTDSTSSCPEGITEFKCQGRC